MPGIFGGVSARETQRADGLAEHLWAEHGWSLTGPDVAGILICVLFASLFLV